MELEIYNSSSAEYLHVFLVWNTSTAKTTKVLGLGAEDVTQDAEHVQG